MQHEEDYRPVRELATDAIPAAVVVVHRSGALAMVNVPARRFFGLTDADIGREFEALPISERPVELRSAVERVQKEQQPLVLEYLGAADDPNLPESLEIHLVPVADRDGTAHGVVVTFFDVSQSRRLEERLERSERNRRTAFQELASANEELQKTAGQLQSAIDELERIDGKLRSTNEELQTMDAELHSTKEELQSLGDELRVRAAELREVNDFLESVLISQRGAVVIVDRDLRISVWSDRSAELWGLRSDEAPGQHVLNVDIGLPVEALRDPLRAILAGDSDGEIVELDASHRRGREFRCRVSMRPLVNRAGEIRGVILVMEKP